MPLKGLKNFTRRRSAGNELDVSDDKTPAQSSFRVLPRADTNDYPNNRSVAGSRPNSSPNEIWSNGYYDHGNRLTNRTNNSSSTEASSIDRFSYASTQPSSLDSRSQDDLSNHFQKHSTPPQPRQPESPQEPERPKPKHRFSLADAGRTFSFGRPKPQKANSSPSQKDPDGAPVASRERSMTASSYASSYGTQSTAHPPKVDMGYDPESPQAEAGASWFSGVGGRRTPIVEEPPTMQPPLPPPPAAQRQHSESPSHLSQKKQFSWDEDDERPPMPLSSRLENSPRPDHASSRRSWESNASESAFLSRGSYHSPPPPRQGLGLKTATSPTMPQPESPTQAESPGFDAPDNQGLLDAITAGAALDEEYAPKPAQYLPDNSRSGSSPTQTSRQIPFRSMHTSRGPYDDNDSSNTTPKARPARPHYDDNASTIANTRPNTMYHLNERSSVMPRNTKIMTKAEFESLKQSSAGRDEDTESQKSDESDVYDDEDETERAKQLAKQRRKQEAHLAVYRQQMMKVTGEQPGDLPSLTSGRPTVSRSTQSLPSLNSVQIPTMDPSITQAETPTKSSDEEDDDVPLGVLQAHGFPSKSRPPTRLTSASTSTVPRLSSQMSTYPIPPGAARNDPTAGGGGNPDLPAFARNLPRDPYVGSNLVNQSTRQSLGQNYQASPASPLPPGGLVGVIAGEERAKAMRRGSPNVNGTYGPVGGQQYPGPQMPHPGMLSPGMGMPFMPMQQPSLGEQSQMQANQQLQQMMQMQMQWMQQMMQMQGMQFPPAPGMMPRPQQQAQAGATEPFWNPQSYEGGMQQNRESMMSSPSMTNEYQNYDQRSPSAMSLMPPTGIDRSSSFMGGYNPNLSASSTIGGAGGYAPSIAPSERSNVGQPSRYRPVSNNVGGSQPHNSRTNTMSGAIDNELNVAKSRSRSPHKLDLPSGPGQGFGAVNPNPSTVRAVNKPKKGGGGGGGSDDEEDDAAWAEMRKRREERRSRWMARKQEKEEAEAPYKKNEGMEGLYYEG